MSTDMVIFNLQDTLQLGEVLAKSGFFTDSREAAQCVTKILAGREMGIGPIAAMTGIYIVKGRVTLSANLMAAQIKRSGRYDYRVTQLDEMGCSITFFDQGERIGISTFTMKEAKAGKLDQDWDKDSKSWKPKATWQNFPRNMLFARAISNGAKWFCPDVFSGPVYTPDELGSVQGGSSYVDTQTGEIVDQPTQEPLATDKQRNYIAGLQDDMGWRSHALAEFAKQHGVDDLVTMSISQAKTLITALKQEAERSTEPIKPAKPNGKAPPTRDGLLKRIAELTVQADNLELEIILSKPLEAMTDEELIKHGTNLKAAIEQVQEAVKA